MSKIKVLDCTLRDGGYCNQWEFGRANAKSIVCGLCDAGLDVVECGFLTNKVTAFNETTKFRYVQELAKIFPNEKAHQKFVCMVNYGEYNADDLPEKDEFSVDGIRVAFHKKNLIEAVAFCKAIKKKGYEIYVQPMVSMTYTEQEFLELIRRCNELLPTAFYIVDSFGSMKKEELVKYFDLVEQNLRPEISIGFHCHNNMQLAYSNAQIFIALETAHELIVDASVMGMGRGAGNLNTELFVEYLNDNYDGKYKLSPLLNIIDETLNTFYQKNYWGYSLSNYLSAKHNLHPNYAGYLDDKKTLTVKDIDLIFTKMSAEKKCEYDQTYIEELYLSYMNKDIIYEEHLADLKERINNQLVLVVAPGKSSEVEREKIVSFAKKNKAIVVSVNFDYPHCEVDYIFVSNLRRFKNIDKSKRNKMVVTSNITDSEVYLQTSYNSLMNNIETVKDNAGMMLIRFLITLGAERIVLAGVDGYCHDVSLNYGQKNMELVAKTSLLDDMNKGMQKMLEIYSKEVEIAFLTSSHFVIANH